MFWQDEPLRHRTPVWQTDRQTELQYSNRACLANSDLSAICWFCIVTILHWWTLTRDHTQELSTTVVLVWWTKIDQLHNTTIRIIIILLSLSLMWSLLYLQKCTQSHRPRTRSGQDVYINMTICYVCVSCYHKSVYHLLSVTIVHPTHRVETFGNIPLPFCTLAILWSPRKILQRSSQGKPFIGGVKCKSGSKSERCHVQASHLLMSFVLSVMAGWKLLKIYF